MTTSKDVLVERLYKNVTVIAIAPQKTSLIMLVPLISFLFGLLMLRYAFLAYTGSPLLQQKMPGVPQRTGDLLWLIGCLLVALALTLGIVGFFSILSAERLRLIRIMTGSIGLLILALQIYKGNTKQQRKLSLSEAALIFSKEFFLVVAIALSFFYLNMPTKKSNSHQQSPPQSHNSQTHT